MFNNCIPVRVSLKDLSEIKNTLTLITKLLNNIIKVISCASHFLFSVACEVQTAKESLVGYCLVDLKHS